MTNELLSGPESRKKILEGINKTTDAIAITIGPQGRNQILCEVVPVPLPNGGVRHQKMFSSTKDGVTVSRSITHPDTQMEAGGMMVKDVCERTVAESGDGTSSAASLFRGLVARCEEALESGINPYDLKKGMELCCQRVVEFIAEKSKPLEGDRMKQIAIISANNDEKLGATIAEVTNLVGADGIIHVVRSQTNETYSTKSPGTQISEGFVSPHFVNVPNRLESELINPYIILFEERINTIESIFPIIESILKDEPNAHFLFIAKEYSTEVVNFLVSALPHNQKRPDQKTFTSCAIKTPMLGQMGEDVMSDLAVLLNGTYISQESAVGLNPDNKNTYVNKEHLGRCGRVTINPVFTTLIDPPSTQDQIDERVKAINAEMELVDDKDFYKKRIAALRQSVAVLYVGGATEGEVTEKLHRVDDALKACRAAQAEGYVQGGGTVFLLVQSALKQLDNAALTTGISEGIKILAEAIKDPYLQILKNAGVNSPQEKYPEGLGYNAKTFKVENLYDAGVIDPAKVLRTSLQNATSGASLYILVDGVIVNS